MSNPKERFCCNCGDSIGFVPDFYYDRRDVCGKHDCQREARDDAYAEREEAHEQLDRDMGW